MATLNWVDADAVIFNPISSQLANLPDAAGTIACLVQWPGGARSGDFCGLTDGGGSGLNAQSNWYHVLGYDTFAGEQLSDDDGIVGASSSIFTMNTDWWIFAVQWPGSGVAVERFHYMDLSVGTWTHENSATANGGLRAGPSTTAGQFVIGFAGDSAGSKNIALCAVWAGTTFSDGDIEDLGVHLKTSDWYNLATGLVKPTTLVECNTLTPTDIGLHPSTFSEITAGVALTGGNPPGWTFDGQGSGGGGTEVTGSSAVGTTTAVSEIGSTISAGEDVTMSSGVGTDTEVDESWTVTGTVPFPSSPSLDSFTRANGNLATGNWSVIDDIGTSPVIAGDAVQAQPVGTGTSRDTGAYWNASTPDADQEVWATLDTAPTGGFVVVLWARITGPGAPSPTSYALIASASGLGFGKSGSSIGSAITETLAAGDGIGLRCEGSTLTAWYRSGLTGDWTQVGTVTDATLTGGGSIGVEVFGNGSAPGIREFGGGNMNSLVVGPKMEFWNGSAWTVGELDYWDGSEWAPIGSSNLAPTSDLLIGINAAADWPQSRDAAQTAVGAQVWRLDIARGSTNVATAVAEAVAADIKPIVLFSDYTVAAATVASFVSANPGIWAIEVGNEDSYSGNNNNNLSTMTTKAAAYARQIKAIKQALGESGPMVLCQADNGTWQGSSWVDTMFSTVSDLLDYVDAWVIHPYGKIGSGRDPITRLNALIDQVTVHGGGSLPVFATEYGIATDDGATIIGTNGETTSNGWSLTLTYAQAGAGISSTVPSMKSTCQRLGLLCVYQDLDQKAHGTNTGQDDHFGLVTRIGTGGIGTPKAGYADAVAALVAA